MGGGECRAGGKKGERHVPHVEFPAGGCGWEANSCWSARRLVAALPCPHPVTLGEPPPRPRPRLPRLPWGAGCTGDFQGPRGSGPPRPRAPRLASGPPRLPQGAGDSLETPGSVFDALAGRPGDVSHLGTSVSPPVKQDGRSREPCEGQRALQEGCQLGTTAEAREPGRAPESPGDSDPHPRLVGAGPRHPLCPSGEDVVPRKALAGFQAQAVGADSPLGSGSAPAGVPASVKCTPPRVSAEVQPSPLGCRQPLPGPFT